MELCCGNRITGIGCGRNAKALLVMLLFAASRVASASPNYWTIQGMRGKPELCDLNAGDGNRPHVYVGVLHLHQMLQEGSAKGELLD